MASTSKDGKGPARDITLGVEFECYTITLGELAIGRHFMVPRKEYVEKGESYHLDRSIGNEYSSRPYFTIREALFGMKAGLRKFTADYQFGKSNGNRRYALFLAGTWRERYAGTHFHLGLGEAGIEWEDAEGLARCLHAHLPLLVALMANSPVTDGRITNLDSNRYILSGERIAYPLEYGELDDECREEMTYNKSRKKKVPTLEIRPCDANLPEYASAGLALLKAVTMAWMARKTPLSRNSNENHIAGLLNAASYGPRAELYWNDKPLSADAYLDRFFREYGPWIGRMDVPSETFEVFRLFKHGWNGAGIIRRACRRHHKRHPRSWERHFAADYIDAINALLNGETLRTFCQVLGLRPPDTSKTRLGGKAW